jgi:hypothetical protein
MLLCVHSEETAWLHEKRANGRPVKRRGKGGRRRSKIKFRVGGQGVTSLHRWASPFSPFSPFNSFANRLLPFASLSAIGQTTSFRFSDELTVNGLREITRLSFSVRTSVHIYM